MTAPVEPGTPRAIRGLLWLFRAGATAFVLSLEFVGWVFFTD